MSIYNAIGGAPAVNAAVDLFYDKVLADDLLAPWFTATDMTRQKAHMRAFLAVAIGGPDLYKGRDMAAAHAHLKVTGEAFDRVVVLLVDTLTELEVPVDITEAIGGKLLPLRGQVVAEVAA